MTLIMLRLVVILSMVIFPQALIRPINFHTQTKGSNVHHLLRQATSSNDLKDRGKHVTVETSAPKQRRPGKRSPAEVASAMRRLAKSELATRKDEKVGELTKLTAAIDKRLHEQKPVGSDLVNGLIRQSRDSMEALLRYNDLKQSPKFRTSTTSTATRQIVVLFGKPLLHDQVTVEYASRIRTLGRLLMDPETPKPDLVCFCGGIQNGNHISDADAGFMFFQHLCTNEGISLDNINFFLDRTSKNEGKALQHVVNHIIKTYVCEWLAVSQETESPTDEFGMERKALRKKVNIHFTLISTEYHLCNLNDIHHRSPNQSLLRPIEMLRTADRSHEGIMTEYDDEVAVFEKRAKQGGRRPNHISNLINGIIDCSWSYKYSTYPYSYTKDDASAFMGRCYLLGEELIPLYVNMKGVVADREFLQRDNYDTAASIRHELVMLMENLYKTSPELRSDLRERRTIESKRSVDVILEGATLSLGRCMDLVRAAGLQQASVSNVHFSKAFKSLEHCITQIQTFCDPDRPLDVGEWGIMEDELPTEPLTEGGGI
jgi:hypothetical protein